MRQNSTNVFNEGLNFDLNPIATPNNILTDCVNGTFLTFNGDELALQNDAGNTKIKVPGTDPAEYVELSAGFFPLGIKEYGGVLYIVSAKLPTDTSVEYNASSSYNSGDVVYIDNFEKVYYLCKLNNNSETPPAESNKWWEVIGDKKDYNNRFAEVEFGSYPSPEASGEVEYDGILREFTAADNFDSLYNKVLINDAFFKTSRYITFDGGSVGTNGADKVSGYVDTGEVELAYNPMFYKVKLYHQLNSGYLDLTNNIWTKYLQYLQSNSIDIEDNFWFTDDFFRYYCPSQYKGKLFISIEIEDLEKFELASYPKFDPNGSNYDFIISVLAIGTGIIDITDARVEIWIDEVKYDFSGSDYEDVEVIDNIATFTLPNIDAANYNKVLRYRVTPVLDIEGTQYVEADFPTEYIEQYVIEGSRLINTLYDNISFDLTPEDECISDTFTRRYVEAILMDSAGNLIDNELVTSTDRYVFLHNSIDVSTWESANPDDVVMGVYMIVNSRPVITSLTADAPPDIVVSFFENTEVIVEDIPGCVADEIIVPMFIGVGSDGIPTIISETGEYKTQAFPGVQISGLDYARSICIDYDSDDKLLFVGGKAGALHIFDLNDQDAIVHKEIKIYVNSTDPAATLDLGGVRIIKKGTSIKEIMVAHGKDRAFIQQYHSDIEDYVDYVEAQETGNFPNSTVGYITDFLYYGGYYYAGSTDLEFFRSQTPLTGWTNYYDLSGVGLRLAKGATRLFYLAVDSNERILYSPTNSPTSWQEAHLSSPGKSVVRDIVMLEGDDCLITAENVSDGLYRFNYDLSSTSLISEMDSDSSSCYYNNSDFVYTGGLCYDGSKYAYIATKQYSYSYKIVKYNAYPSGGEDKYGTCIDIPKMYYKLYLY